jgi:hypothetical protein
MKRFISLITALTFCLVAVPAFASQQVKTAVLYNNYSSVAPFAAVYSSAINTTTCRTKSVQVLGVTSTAGAASTLDGTFLIQVGPTSSGPWITANQQDSTAISMTANGVLSWDDSMPYVRASWTKTSKAIKAWFFCSDY